MLRKYLARLLAFALVLNLVLCAPLSVGAEEAAEGDQPSATPIITDAVKDDLTISQDGTLVVTDDASVSSSVTISEPDVSRNQTVTVETPLVGTEIDDAGKENVHEESYEGNNGETIPYTQKDSFDLNAEITDIEKAGDEVTDIEYDISLRGQTAITEHPAAEAGDSQTTEKTDYYSTPNIDQWLNGTEPEDERCEFKVNMSINGMNDQQVTRVEHKYKENADDAEEKVEYYYNPNTKTNTDADNGKKFFTVVKETAKNVQSSFVSLVTNFLGKFHITTDAFENQETKQMSTTLDEAVNNAETGSTVEMLRNYTTDKTANVTTRENVTVDLNDKTYSSTVNNSAIWACQGGQDLTIKNGTINSAGDGIYTAGTGNKITVEDVTLKTNVGGGNDNYNMGIWDAGSNTKITVKDSTINSTGSYFGIYHDGSNGGADISVIGSYVYADGATGQGIYVSNNKNNAKNKLTIKDSTIVGDSGVEVKFTDVTIDNSTLIGLGNPGDYTASGNGSTTVGAALAVTDNANGITGGTIIINSGNFKGAKDFDSIYQAVGDTSADITVNGGRFVYPNGLYKFTGSTHAVISHNDGSEYPYEVVAAGTTPTRAGYKFLGFKDDQGKAITLEQAIAKKAIAYAQWELIPTEVDETPVKPATAPAEKPVIIVEPDSKGNNVDVTIKGGTAEVTVSTPAGEAAAVSEVTIPSVAALQEQGVKTVKVQVEDNVTLELGVSKDDDTVADTIKITREDDILVITSGEQSEIAIHMTELKAAAAKPVSIKLDNGVLTIDLGNGAYKLNVGDALAASKSLSVKLEDGVLKLYDKDGNLIQEIKI